MPDLKTKKTRKPRSLVIKRLENVSKDVFRKHFELITELVGSSPGIYALYDDKELYYVGKSRDLKKRVRQHLKDRHLASWTHFSLYLARKEEHIHEIESLLIRVANPKGNRVVPKGKSSGPMLKQLKTMVKQKQKEDFEKMFGSRRSNTAVSKKLSARNIAGLVAKRTVLFRNYKGKDYKAYLLANGTIRYANNDYSSPTAAAKVVVGRGGVNGWAFWYVQDSNGDWVRLSQLRG